jgi:D-glycerate 3-kinase
MESDALRRAIYSFVPDARRVDDYYAPLAVGCAWRAERCSHRPWILGLQGPQGCGKSTLAAALTRSLPAVGLHATAISIDDFYLTHDEQLALAARHPGNPYLLYRGYPGTHDVELGFKTIDAIAALRAGDQTLVPRYEKGAHAGRGDRTASSEWTRVAGPVDVLIIEGWMLGFSPVDASDLEPHLKAPNSFLAEYATWHQRLDAFVRLEVASLETIVAWRVDAERARRDAGEQALSEEDARDYIERFLPAYRVYMPRLRARPPCEDVLGVMLGDDRMPTRRPDWPPASFAPSQSS